MYIVIVDCDYVGNSWMPVIIMHGVVSGVSVCIERSIMLAIASTR